MGIALHHVYRGSVDNDNGTATPEGGIIDG